MEEVIVARCTPQGSGALALIRICGVGALQLVSSVARLSSRQLLAKATSHTIHHGYVIDPCDHDAVIDEVLFFVMLGNRTFVGQDTVEISSHNNPFIIERIIATVIAAGARGAQPGEFSKRAFLNGKMDLIQAEAINDLIHAPSEQALKQSMQQVQGSLSARLLNLEQQILHLLMLVEASFEFLEEEQGDLAINATIKQELDLLIASLSNLISHYSYQDRIKQGVRIVLLGSVNAGKSTLFNALVGQNRAIVSDQAGTTRDSIEQSMYVEGLFHVFVDTAGLRQTDDIIEAEGIRRSMHEAEMADVVLLVIDGSRAVSEQERQIYDELYQRYAHKMVLVHTKADESMRIAVPGYGVPIHVSATQNVGLVQLKEQIDKKVKVLFAQHALPFLLNQRQHDLLRSMYQKFISVVQNNSAKWYDPELLAISLRSMLEQLAELMGKSVTEKLLDAVFKQFCIGK